MPTASFADEDTEAETMSLSPLQEVVTVTGSFLHRKMGMKFSFPHVESLVYFSNIAHQQAVKILYFPNAGGADWHETTLPLWHYVQDLPEIVRHKSHEDDREADDPVEFQLSYSPPC